MAASYPFIPLRHKSLSTAQSLEQSSAFLTRMLQRRSCRDFSPAPVSRKVIENLIKTASSAPSGANKQPWTFVAVSDPGIKKAIREAAEEEEKIFYNGRAGEEWLKDLAPLGTDWHKPFLETAPWLIVIFKKSYDMEVKGKSKNYYVQESVGIAAGFLITAIHHAGLVTLTHTPSPMNFLSDILQRPENEKPFLLLPVGYPDEDARVPDLSKKSLQEVSVFI